MEHNIENYKHSWSNVKIHFTDSLSSVIVGVRKIDPKIYLFNVLKNL